MLWMFHTLCLRPIRRSWGLEMQSRGLWRARASTPAPPPRWCMDRANGVVMIAFSDYGIWLLESTDPSSCSLTLILNDLLARVMASQQPIANREVLSVIECRVAYSAFAVACKSFFGLHGFKAPPSAPPQESFKFLLTRIRSLPQPLLV